MLSLNTIIAIDMGHCLSNADTGAENNGYKEQDLTREVGNKVISKLQSLGYYKIINCTLDSASSVGESLKYRVNRANKSLANLFISIHFNAGGGRGVEIYTYNGKNTEKAVKVLNNIVNLGFNDRGIKNGAGLFVIRNTNMESMLIECHFIDTDDMDNYNAENLANAIVEGITGQSILNQSEDDNKPYRIMTGTFQTVDEAIIYCDYLKNTYNINAYTCDGEVLEGTPVGQYRVITGTFIGKVSVNNFADKLKAQGTTIYIVYANIL